MGPEVDKGRSTENVGSSLHIIGGETAKPRAYNK